MAQLAPGQGRLVVRGQVPALRAKVNIATPAYRSEYAGIYVRTLYGLLTTGTRRGVAFSFSDIDYADIVVARNYLISNFYFNKSDCSHILFIDSDMGFEADLFHEMLELRQEVVGVAYPKRTLDLAGLHGRSGESFTEAYAASCEFIGAPSSGASGAFLPAPACGTGVMLISRTCIDRMIACCPEIVDERRFRRFPFAARFKRFLTPFDKIQLDDRELSEDFSFCRRWTNRCGGLIYVNTSRAVEHVMTHTLHTRFSDLP